MPRRLLATAGVFLFFSGAVLAAGAKPVPVVVKANAMALSQRARDLPPATPDPDEKRPAEWIRSNEALPKGSGAAAPGDRWDGALQTEAPAGGMPGPTLTFDGVSSDDNASAFGFRVLPPDTNADVGPNHVVQIVNLLFRIWDKAGTPLTAPTKLSSLFAPLGAPCGTRDDGDPIVLYDTLADRWLLSQFALPNGLNPPFHQCIAISQTGDPTGAYYVYDYVMPAVLNDYPHFGVWPDGYYMSDNQFAPGGASYAGAGLFAFDRSKMLLGDPTATYIYFDYFGVDPNAGGMLPTHLNGLTPPPTGTPNLFMEWRTTLFGDPTDALRIYEFHADFATPANSTLTARPDLPVAAFDARTPATRAAIEQPAPATSGQYLDAIADRMMYRVAYRTLAGGVQSFVANWTVNVSGAPPGPVTAATYQAGIRFEELRRDPGTGAFTIQNQLTYAPGSGDGAAGRNIWMGSAAQDNLGDSALGFSASSTSLVPSILWAGRLAGDPANTLNQGEATMYSGAGVQQSTSSRWGDYSSMSIDPSDDCTFWYTQQYYATNGSAVWKTRIGNFKFPSCTAAPKGTLNGTVTTCGGGLPVAGAVVTVDGGYVRTTDGTGLYAMDLPPGSYTVTITKAGFTVFSGPAVIVDATTTTVDACLGGTVVIEGAGAALTAENCPPPNGVPDPGETVTISFCVKNTGGSDTVDLVGTLQAIGSVTDPSGPQSYGVVSGGGADVCRDFTFTVDPNTLCGDTISATLALQDGVSDLGTVTYYFQTGVPNVIFAENFDGVAAPALPAGWVAANAAGAAPLWVTSAAAPDTAPNDAFVDDPAGIADKRLDSPPIAIATASAQLTFRNSYVLENAFDGGVLEISIGGGAFADILTAGGSFVSSGYSGTISAGFSSPIAGRQAWTGNSAGYVTTVVNLPAAAAGQSVVLRWRMGSDLTVAGTGWRIDTISLADGYACCSPLAVSLQVDGHAPMGPAALGINKVFEPGETVVVEPGYFNGSSSPLPLTGTASNFTGPAGATYSLVDVTAGYGTIGTNASTNCFDATGDCYQVSVNSPAVRPAAHWDSTFDELLSSGATKTWTLHIGDSFTDTLNSNIFYRFIETIFHKGITGGCGAGIFCPANDVTRAQMAVFILKAEHGPGYVPPACGGIFTDVACPGAFAVDWIEQLYNEGITGGCGTGIYCPNNPVTRAQMAVFLLKGEHGSAYVPPACAGIFTDVACPAGFAVNWIEELYNEGITGGCGAGIYCPDASVTRGQMEVFLTKTFGLLLYGP
jgi:hypothetical protein